MLAIFGKMIALILYTRLLEAFMLSVVGTENQKKLNYEQEYFARTLKFVIVLVAFAMSVFARIWREDVTSNFTKLETNKQKTNGNGVEEQLLEG